MSSFFDEEAFPEISIRPPVAMTATSQFSAEERLDFRLLFANRIAERGRQEQRTHWTREDIGLLLMDVLEDEFGFEWNDSTSVEHFKQLLMLAYVAAVDVLSANQRDF